MSMESGERQSLPVADIAGRAAPPGPVADRELLHCLRAVLAPGAAVELIGRQRNPRASSCPSETVQVRIGAAAVSSLFLKYETREVRLHVHRKGVDYESAVYREVLAPLGVSTPRHFGCFAVAGAGNTRCLVLEALTTAVPLAKPVPSRIAAAAAWIGRFHRDAARFARAHQGGFLQRFDGGHLGHWMDRAQSVAADHGLAPAWLPALATAYANMVASLGEAPATVVHGEYYPMNILASERGIHPVDWESAAIGAGEIDLASLTMGWPVAQAAECTGAYIANRFHGRAPANFAARLDAARLYLCLRMLGDDRRSPHSGRVPFFDYLRATAIRCGVELPGGDEVAGAG